MATATKGIVGQGNSVFEGSNCLGKWRDFWESLLGVGDGRVGIPRVTNEMLTSGEREGRVLCMMPPSRPGMQKSLICRLDRLLDSKQPSRCLSVADKINSVGFEVVPGIGLETQLFWIDMGPVASERTMQIGDGHPATIEQYLSALVFTMLHNHHYVPDLGPRNNMTALFHGSVLKVGSQLPISPGLMMTRQCYCFVTRTYKPAKSGEEWTPFITPVVRMSSPETVERRSTRRPGPVGLAA